MAPRKRRTAGVQAVQGKENTTPPGDAGRGKTRAPVRRTRRMPARFAPAAPVTPRSGQRTPAALFRRRAPATALSLERRRESFDARAAAATDLCSDDPAFEDGPPPPLAFWAEPPKDGVACDEDMALIDILAADRVCDDSLSAAELLTRMRWALLSLRRISNLTEGANRSSALDANLDAKQSACAEDKVVRNPLPVAETGARSRANKGGRCDATVKGAMDGDDELSPSALRELLLDLATAIAVDRFVGHTSNAVRLLAACILAEILRISAPDPPLPMDKLAPIAALFVDQIIMFSAAHDPLQSYRLGLLEQLAAVKTFVVFCDDEDLVADLFACSYALIAVKHPQRVFSLVSHILVSVLEEAEVVTQRTLDASLAPLVPSRVYPPEAVSLAERVVAASCNALQVPLCNFFNAVLRSKTRGKGSASVTCRKHFRSAKSIEAGREDDSDDEQAEAEMLSSDIIPSQSFLPRGSELLSPPSALSAEVEVLLTRVNSVAPDILIYVIPNLERDLHAGDVQCRLRCVQLLSSLFAASSDMVSSYPSLFADFISRAKDSEECIRIALCEAASKLLAGNPHLRDDFVSRLRERLLDKEEKVRLAAIASIRAVAELVDTNTLHAVADRVKDRKVSVRQAALGCLVYVYRCGLPTSEPAGGARASLSTSGPPRSPSTSSSSDGAQDTAGQMDNIRSEDEFEAELSMLQDCHRDLWIPKSLLQAYVVLYNVKDYATAAQIESAVLDELHCPRGTNCNEAVRVGSFCLMLSGLDESSLGCFKGIFGHRVRLRAVVRRVVRYRLGKNKVGDREAETSERRPKDPGSSSYHATFSKQMRAQPSLERKVPEVNGCPQHSECADVETLASQLNRCLPDIRIGSETRSTLSTAFVNVPDLNVFKHLSVALDENSSRCLVESALEEAVSRVGSRSPLGEFLRSMVGPKCCAGLCSSRHVKSLFVSCQANGKVFSVLSDAVNDSSGAGGDSSAQDVALGALERLSLGCSRYLELTCQGFAESYFGSNSSLVADMVLSSPVTFQESGKEECGLSGVSLRNPPRYSATVLHEAFVCFMRPCLLKLVYSLGSRPFTDSAERMVSVCRALALSSGSDPKHVSLVSKWATRVFLLLAKSSSSQHSLLVTFMSDLTLCLDRFDGNLESIVAPLTALTQVAKYVPDSFKPVALSAFDFARALLMGTMNSRIQVYLDRRVDSSINPGTDDECSRASVARLRTLRRWSFVGAKSQQSLSLVGATVFLGETAKRATKLLTEAVGHLDAPEDEICSVLDTLVGIIVSKNGNVFGLCDEKTYSGFQSIMSCTRWSDSMDAVADMCGLCRLAASVGVLHVARDPRLFKSIRPTQFLAVALCAQDEHPDIRISFARKVVTYVSRKRLQFRWAVSLCLMGIDPDKDNHEEVKQLFSSVVRYRRRALLSVRQSRPERSQALLDLSPEAALPDLVWVAANHPDIEADEANGYVDSEKYLEFFFDRLLETHEYASVMNQYLINLSMAADARDELKERGAIGKASRRISSLARLATSVLERKRAGRKWTMLEYSGEARLPADLFVLRAEPASEANRDNTILNVAKNYDQDAAHLNRSAERRRQAVCGGHASTPSSSRTADGPRAVPSTTGRESTCRSRVSRIPTSSSESSPGTSRRKRGPSAVVKVASDPLSSMTLSKRRKADEAGNGENGDRTGAEGITGCAAPQFSSDQVPDTRAAPANDEDGLDGRHNESLTCLRTDAVPESVQIAAGCSGSVAEVRGSSRRLLPKKTSTLSSPNDGDAPHGGKVEARKVTSPTAKRGMERSSRKRTSSDVATAEFPEAMATDHTRPTIAPNALRRRQAREHKASSRDARWKPPLSSKGNLSKDAVDSDWLQEDVDDTAVEQDNQDFGSGPAASVRSRSQKAKRSSQARGVAPLRRSQRRRL